MFELTSSLDSPIIRALHHFRPGIENAGLSSCDETVKKSGTPGTVSPSNEGIRGALMGTFCQRSSIGNVSNASMRSFGDLSASPKASMIFSYADSAAFRGKGLNSKTAPPVLRHRFIIGSFEHRNMVTDTAGVSCGST
jgi:hypothetical protein